MKNGMQFRKLREQNHEYINQRLSYNKKLSLTMAGYLKLVGASYRNVLNCANKVVIGYDNEGNVKTKYVNRCGNPLCPNCQKVDFKRKSLHNAKILDRLVQKNPNGYFKHFTFSCENAYDGDDLHSKYVKLSQAINIFFRYKSIKNICLGFIDSFEDKPSFNRGYMTYNVHSHTVAYFSKDADVDIKKCWMRATKRCGLNKDEYCYSEPIKATKGHNALDNAKTVTDYDSKPFNWLDNKITGIKSKKNQVQAIKDHVVALYRLQKTKWHGQCAKIHDDIRRVNNAKKVLRKKYNKSNDLIQMIIKYNSRKRRYYYNGIQVENHYLAKHANSLAEIHQYRDSQPYVE